MVTPESACVASELHQKALAWDKTARFERRCLVFEIEAFSPKVRAMEMALRWCCAGPHTLQRGYERVMGLLIDRLSSRLPRRFPVGAKYVVEGYGGEKGNLRLIARYIVLPDGRRINVPADLSQPASSRALAFRRRSNSK